MKRLIERLKLLSAGYASVVTVVLFLVVFLLLITGDVFARAGGGQSYSSGGHSSGGGGSGGGGGAAAEVVWVLIRLTIEYPAVGIPIWVVIIAVFYYTGNEGKEIYVDRTIRRGVVAQKSVNRSRAEEAIRSRDPAWNTSVFLPRVQQAFQLIQSGWSSQDLTKIQNFVSDGVLERFTLQIIEQREAGIRDHMEGLKILEAKVAKVDTDKHFDSIHVYFRAIAVNYRVDLKTGMRTEGTTAPEEFEEYWSFLRKPGAKTISKPGLIEGFCPNCSAPLAMTRVATCEACGSYLRSGEYDWVLAEITQACEWAPREAVEIPGFNVMTQQDPGFNIQHIEDRSSVIFWRFALAERLGDVGPMKRFAISPYCDELARQFLPQTSGERTYFGSCAVGSVDLRALDVGNEFDKIYVEIRWSGKPLTKKTTGIIEGMNRSSRNVHNAYVFLRKHGVVTDTRMSLISAHCMSCGAPEKTGQEFICEYCGTVLNDGSKEWTLEKIISPNDYELVKLIQSARDRKSVVSSDGVPLNSMFSFSPTSGAKAMRWMISMMLSDNIVDDREMAMLKNFGKKCGVSESKILEMIEQQKSGVVSDNQDFVSADIEEGRHILRGMTAMALADGRLSSEEMALLQNVAKKVNLTLLDLKMIINKERSRLYDEAKKVITAAKKLPPT